MKEFLTYKIGRCFNHFKENIQAYNYIIAFTSIGAKIDNIVNLRPGPYVYKISGQNYHMIKGLIPEKGKNPKFSQLYVYMMHKMKSEIDCVI